MKKTTKIKCKSVEKAIADYGKDWSELVFAPGLVLADCDISDIVLPRYPSFFQDIQKKSLEFTKMPAGDYSIYDFTDVVLSKAIFPESGVIFPTHNDFLIKLADSSLEKTVLPCLDYSMYKFDNVFVKNTFFPKNSKLPEDTELFVKIKNSDLTLTTLPDGDYSNYNFNGVRLRRTRYSDGVIFPTREDFFQKLENISGLDQLPTNVIENIHLYNFDNVEITLSEFNFTPTQMLLLSAKTKNNLKVRIH